MSSANMTMENGDAARPAIEVRREHQIDRQRDNVLDRSVLLEPQPDSWKVVASGTVVPLGLAVAAAVTTYLSNDQRVSMTSWIAVAIVGTASVVSAASVSRRRVVTVERDNHVDNSIMRDANRHR
ncbi:hypothetical protein [Schlesneria paludicola]|uniref:hypothetical protein n=1 Tax=Schlesneria paludicola TaxID=360056 RepID=UPI00029B2836|nr:hypothetical protein [Schlesneria paludicola]